MIIANLGDSRAVLGTVSEDGRLEAVQLTIDLKPNVPRKNSSLFQVARPVEKAKP